MLRKLGSIAFLCSLMNVAFAGLAISNAGFTPGELSVSQNGAANYSIPIVVPPGVAGMAPSLSLNYNSQGGNGRLGVGWTLGGLRSSWPRPPKICSRSHGRSSI